MTTWGPIPWMRSSCCWPFEETFGIEIPDDAADPMQRVRDAVTYIEARVASGVPPRAGDRATDSSTENARS